MDKLTVCAHCGNPACYEQHIDESTTTWMCISCGFSSSTVMKEGAPAVKAVLESAPELYKDLMFVDKDQYVWFPATMTVPEKGMIFVDGTSKENWKWAAAPAVLITEEYRREKKYPKTQSHRIDMTQVKYFAREDFLLAMDFVGFFN